MKPLFYLLNRILKTYMKQGEIWLVNIGSEETKEIQLTKKAVVVNEDAIGELPLKIAIPITDWKEKHKIVPWMVNIKANLHNGLSRDSSADCVQIRSISDDRFLKKIGKVSDSVLNDIKKGLSKVLSIDYIKTILFTTVGYHLDMIPLDIPFIG